MLFICFEGKMSCCLHFGIIQNIEQKKNYCPNPNGHIDFKDVLKLYNCISVSDDIVNDWIPLTTNMPTFLFSLDNEYKGLDHYAVTLIPPNSVKMFLETVSFYQKEKPGEKTIKELISLLKIAIENNKYIICFGI